MVKLIATCKVAETHNMSAGIDIFREVDELLDFIRGDEVKEKDRPTAEKLSVAL